MIMPISAGVPTKLQKVMDDPSAVQISLWDFDLYPWADGYYDPAKKAIVQEYPSDTILYIVHGIQEPKPNLVPKEEKEIAWIPFLVRTFIDEQEIQMLRYAEPRFNADGKLASISWRFYHIFEQGDLPVGDHTFDMHFYYREGNNPRTVYFKWLQVSTEYYAGRPYPWDPNPPYDVQALIIRIVEG